MEKKYIFPKVDLLEVARSNHNLDKSLMFSFSPGTARWLWGRDVLPKDHWEISLSASIESMPMLAPLYGSFKATWAFYFEPWSNIYGWMDNNKRQTTQEIITQNLMRYSLPISYKGMVLNEQSAAGVPGYASFPQFAYSGIDSVAPSSIWEDFGYPTGWNGSVKGVSEYYKNSQDLIDDANTYFVNVDFSSLGGDVDDYVSQLNIPRYLGLGPKYLHAVKPLAYLDIVRNYYVNNQLEFACYISSNPYDDKKEIRTYVKQVNLSTLDYIMMYVRTLPSTSYHLTDFDKLSTLFEGRTPIDGYSSEHVRAVLFLQDWEKSFTVPNGGCFLTNYQMDLNRGLLATSVGNYKSNVDTTSGSFSIDTLRMQNKIQQLIDILDLTGGRFSDWVRALWSVNIKGDVDKPIYIGSYSQIISTTDIVSPSTTAGSTAGSQTGFAAGGLQNGRKITFNSDIYGTICCIFTYTPIVSYSNVFKREDVKTSFQDIYNPRMAQLGYQGVPQQFLSAEYKKRRLYDTDGNPVIYTNESQPGGVDLKIPFPVGDFIYRDEMDTLVGKQVAWAEYMSDIDESRGLFANNQSLEYWVLNRDYMYSFARTAFPFVEDVEEFDGTTYIDPAKWQNLFADVEPNAQNFRQFCKFNVFVKRPIPKRTLGRL